MTFPFNRLRSIAARHVETIPGVIRAGVFIVLFTLIIVPTVRAEPEPDGEETPRNRLHGFSPYLTTGPFTTIQRVRASINTDFGIKDRSANTLTNLGWSFEIGVQSPRFEDLPGKPRFGIAGGILIPYNASGTIGSSVAIIQGQFNDKTKEETKLAVDYKNSYRAGIGAEFLSDPLGLNLRFTPGLEYLFLDSRYVGEVSSVRTFIGGIPEDVRRGSRAKADVVQHFFGPSLRVGTEPIEMLGVQADLFIHGSLLFDMAGTRRFRSKRDAGNRRSAFNWEASTTAGYFKAGFRILLP
ncbi:MAG: hypothetical protein AB8G23_11995 [Myxococcota bacterium]